jgi:hypothetical protein
MTNSKGCSMLRRNTDSLITRISELTDLQANQRRVKEDENMMINCEWEEATVPYLPEENRGNNGPQDIR